VNQHDNDAWDLATLAAQLLHRHNTPSDAVDAAWSLIEAAKRKLEGVRLEALLESPDARAELENEEASRLANLHLQYEQGVKSVTSQARWDRALKSFRLFLASKAREKERTDEGITARTEAMLAKYRARGFSGTEANKLRGEFEQWRGKGKQGRVKKRASDGRLKENREKKRQQKGKQAMAELTRPKLDFEAVRPFVNRGKKTPRHRDPATFIPLNDTP